MTTTSASTAWSVASKPACSSSPAIRSESWTFIWQPKVSIRYLRATSTFRFRPFAFRLQHLTCGLPKAIGDRFPAKHARELVDAAIGIETAHGRLGPAALDPLFDLEVCIRVRRNLRQVRDAQYLEGGTQRSQRAADDVGDATADAGIDLVEDQSGGRRARRAIGGVAEPVARRRRQRFDREHDSRQLPARHDARERTEILAGVRRHEKLRVVDAVAGPGRFGQRVAETH